MTDGLHTERSLAPSGLSTPPRGQLLFRRGAPLSEQDVAVLRSFADRIDPADPGAWNNLGVLFYQKGLVADAVAAFERAIELGPYHRPSRENLRIALSDTGYHVPRVRELQARLMKAPDDHNTRAELARLHLMAGELEQAADEWLRLLEVLPRSPTVHRMLARTEAERRRVGRALKLLERAAELEPTEPGAHLERAELLERAARIPEAEAAVRMALERKGDVAHAYGLLGRLLEAQERTAEAREALERTRRLDPYARLEGHLSLARYRSASLARARRQPAPRTRPAAGDRAQAEGGTRVSRAMAGVGAVTGRRGEGQEEEAPGTPMPELLASARTALRQGQLRRAEAVIARVLAMDPSDMEGRQLQGELLLRRGLPGQALERFDAVLANQEDHKAALLGRARALLEEGRAREAVAAARAAIRAGAEGGDALLARTLLAAGDAGAAVEAFESALSGSPHSATLLTGYGEALLADGFAPKAEWVFREALQQPGSGVAATVGLAACLAEMGRWKEAEETYRRAVAELPSFSAAAFGLADVLWRRHRSQEAVRALVEFLILDPTHADALARLGDYLFELGRRDQAAAAKRRALQIDPENAAARARLARLASGEEA